MQITATRPYGNRVRGRIKVPGDKSISHRSVILGSIASGLTLVDNFLTGEDCMNTMKAFQALGVEMDFDFDINRLTIIGAGISDLQSPRKEIYLGNSGTGMRLLTGLFAGLPFSTTLTGDHSLQTRPMNRVIKPLESMGAQINSQEGGKAPLVINPNSDKLKLNPIEYDSPIASAQVKSAILLAGLHTDGITSVIEPFKSRDHLEKMLEYFGAFIINDHNKVSIDGINSRNNLFGQQVVVPNDISSAAFFMVAGAILEDAQITVTDIGINPTRTGIIDVLDKMLVDYDIIEKRLSNNEEIASILVRSSNPQATTIEGSLIPRLIDEIPIIAILASMANGTTVIKDAHELKVKESNRIASTVNMLRKLGVKVEETDDGMIIEGRATKRFEPPEGEVIIDSLGDHRIAMASAIAALHSNKPVTILQTEFVSTSFPGFFEILENLKNTSVGIA
ncbi:MAG: 3-phosphoshikimate 1-carboxyvinyltransferase [Candidatus Caenarcaniphilales bacterium]|jgi:3-phosphoshikimate 1-carboxyvinyltransferase|nr:3-phosphoshikimate 1-carboxyvinyltransferase [Candidatus Caenarcaniphilales bacterium]